MDSLWKITVFTNHPNALQFIYYDDIEVAEQKQGNKLNT